ncbi:DUF1801 domain-containing protein [Oceanobacillus indicireducens]|uniref:YdhG-like domain-containing protein n=1 Tax=Oceanobacillus indicireducens TaxID=1004261 RepID=A0A917Y5A7_9BACI|nr:DUF1801 domain-containing protein [Oceanobacillus indicireducens]GGN65783.1 hypothetical protein GCM10007971_35040 [Oceanobacillus indicireducens]
MYELKTKENDRDVVEFIESVDHPKRREDAYKLLDIFSSVTGRKAKMWGPSIICYGSYHYKYASGHEGDAPIVGFSPRKARHSIYVMMDEGKREKLLENFGKYKAGKACVYVNKLEDIDRAILEEMIKETVAFVTEHYEITDF